MSNISCKSKIFVTENMPLVGHPYERHTDYPSSFISKFFHDFHHHSCSQLKAVLEYQAVGYGLELTDAIRVLLKQLYLFVCHGSLELFLVPEDQLH